MIRLRIVGFSRRGAVYAICLETYSVVRAESLPEAKRKMADALTVYLRSFKEEELLAGAYFRPAPLRYRVLWAALSIVGSVNKAILTIWSSFANYDPQSARLSVA